MQGCSQIPDSNFDPVNCNGYQPVIDYSVGLNYLETGSVGLYFAGSSGYADDLAVRHRAASGKCGDGTCQPDFGEVRALMRWCCFERCISTTTQ